MNWSKLTWPSRTSGVSAVTTTKPDCSRATRSRSVMSLVELMTATVVGSFTLSAYHPHRRLPTRPQRDFHGRVGTRRTALLSGVPKPVYHPDDAGEWLRNAF